MRLTLTVTLALTAALAAAAPAGADWPTFGHDLSNARNARADGPSVSQLASLRRAWTFDSPHGDFTATPIVAGGTVVAGTNLGSIYALDAVTGRLLWSRDVGHQINGSAAIDVGAPGGPAVFVPVARVGQPALIALDLRTGALRWQRLLSAQPGSDVFGSPVFWRRTIYVGTSGPNNDETSARGSVVALDEGSGDLRWRTFTVPPGHDGGAVWSTPAIDTATGRLYVGTGNAYHAPAADTTDSLLVLSAANGRILRHFQSTSNDVFQVDSPAAGPDYDFGDSPNLFTAPDGRRLVGAGQKSGTYWALDRTTMRPVWRTTAGPGSQFDGGVNSTAYDGARIYGSDAIDSQVFALGRGGSMLWSSADGGTVHFSEISVGHGVVWSASSAGALVARDPSTGSILATLPLGGPEVGGISLVGGAVYAATGTGPPLEPLPQTNFSQSDGNGSIVAFGDTSRAAAAGGADTFDGSCKLSGTVLFDPGLTVAPHPLDQHVRASGSCSGTFTDRSGRTHHLAGAPATYVATEHASSASCAGGTDAGSGALYFPYGAVRFTTSETRPGVVVAASLTGARGGSAAGTAAPSADGSPVTVARQCSGAGLRAAHIDINAQTTPSMSG